jgi:fatty-acyl-CoA synthase
VPQLGAVVVPLNYRLIAEDFVYLINHSGARMVCVHSDYLDVVEGIRARCPNVEQFVALEGAKTGWLDYESMLAQAGTEFPRTEIAESDLLAINYTSGTTAKPKGVMITRRNAWVNAVGTLIHHPMSTADRYLWTLPMFHANGWTFVWVVTAAGATHVCLRKVEPAAVFEHLKGERITMFCAAPTVLIGIANAPAEMRRHTPCGLRVMTAGAPPSAATIERVEQDLGWTITHVYGLTETAPFITINEPCPEFPELSPEKRAAQKARQGVELITSGELRVVDEQGRDVPRDGATLGEIIARGNVIMAGYYNDPEATATAMGAAGFTPATRRWWTPTATWKSATASRMSSSAAARTSLPSKSKGYCCATPRYWKWRWSACRTRNGAKRRTRSSCCVPASRPAKRKSTNSPTPT